MQTVYIDLLFLINFCMDFLCIIAVSKITSRHLSYIRAAIGAAVGGIYSVSALFMPNIGAWELIPALICCTFMCIVAFARKNGKLKEIIITTLTYLLSSALLGGIMTGAFNLLNSYEIDFETAENSDIPAWLLIAVGTFSLVSTYFGGKMLRKRFLRKTASVHTTLFSNEINFNAMYDTGNLLSDGISGKPVIVVDKCHAKKLLGFEAELDAISRISDSKLSRRISIIPYTSAGGKKLMVAVRPDKTTVTADKSERAVSALIGFADVSCAIDGCSALIPPEL